MDAKLPSQLRFFLEYRLEKSYFTQNDQHQGIQIPAVEKPWPREASTIVLPQRSDCPSVRPVDLTLAIERRVSSRRFLDEPLLLDELAYLLWATQGIRHVARPGVAFRTVPSAGCRHALETYLCIQNVTGIEQGLYRYLPIEHALLPLGPIEDLANRLVAATLDQTFTGTAAVTFVWSAIPYRMEWRYGTASPKFIALDAGHVCQNLYLACSAVRCGTCAVAAYDQDLMDRLIGVDGKEELTVYLAPVGKIQERSGY